MRRGPLIPTRRAGSTRSRSSCGNWGGSGHFLLRFNPNGTVGEVAVDCSTGRAVLDQISANTFRRWRSHPGACRTLMLPFTFTLGGAQL
jgi:hypothetical protein